METSPKSPQEIAAQIMDAHPYFGDYYMSTEQSNQLVIQAKELIDKVKDSEPYLRPDEELKAILTEAQNQSEQSGVWKPTEGQGSDERITYAMDRFKGYGFSQEETKERALRKLEKNGSLWAIKQKRREQEQTFKDPMEQYIMAHDLGSEAEKEQVTRLLERTIDIATLKPEELTRLSQDFPSGNFVYHGSSTDQLIKIIDSGALVNARALYEKEDKVTKDEGQRTQSVKRNSGYEGISWSMNGIDALPGDRYHLAGFVASPEAVLGDDEQLAIPSRPAPNEVLQMSGKIEADKFYDAKTQFELYCNPGMLSEFNSVFGNLFFIAAWNKDKNQQYLNEPMLYGAKNGILSEPEYQKKLRDFYTVEHDGKIRLSPDLLQQADNEVPVAAVWLQAAIDTGRLNETQFAGQELPDIIDKLNDKNIKDLINLSRDDWQSYEHTLNEAKKMASNIEVPIERMYFVAPRKDADMWLKLLARSQHKPAGILLYDDKKVRLENFASPHKGDQTELTHELKKAINPDNDNYINYSDVMGAEFTDDMRTGHKHHVIAERYLSKRGNIKKINGKLIVKR
jgi:hypothetical protein